MYIYTCIIYTYVYTYTLIYTYALIKIIDHWKDCILKDEINLAFFVDFKKAFDFLDPKLLKLKLFHYGFDNSSLAFAIFKTDHK